MSGCANCEDGCKTEAESAPVSATGRTERRSDRELSARASQRLSVLAEMTAGIAHDFRNILAVIDSGLRLAERHTGDPQKVSTFIKGARDGVVRGLALTSELLRFAKQPECEARAEDANALLKGLELFLRYGAGSKIRISLDLAAEIPQCLIDAPQFNAAILNLVINARDAMPEGGEIRISTATCPAPDGIYEATARTHVRVRVKDEGIGMSEAVLRNICQPFFTTKGEQGTGLGIPQVRAFLRHVGGHMRVASEVGRGTTFDLFFPAIEASADRPRIYQH